MLVITDCMWQTNPSCGHACLTVYHSNSIKERCPLEQSCTSIQALFSNSCSSSGAVKNRERQIRNKKPRMVGREDDTEMLLDFLIEGEPLLSSIAIVAHGGYGKTTLAAQVYDNIYVMNYFDCRVWVDAL
ncbi:hypothetical protein QYF36_009177 [Acer negundo]|nr:hypothetical protein QYF36_009177 [Acer negundo]